MKENTEITDWLDQYGSDKIYNKVAKKLENMKTLNEQIEAQQLISNINLMRQKIGVQPYTFENLWSRSVDWLRAEQDSTIKHYNEAVRNVQQ